MTKKFDYSKLRGRIREKLRTEGAFSEALGRTHTTISLKLSGKYPFTQEEIAKAVEVLGIPEAEIHAYFFTAAE